MSLTALTWVWGIDVGNPTRKLVLMALADHVNESAECWPSLKTIADRAGCDPRTVRRHLRDLEERGLIDSQERSREDGSQSSNSYRLALPAPPDKIPAPPDTTVRPPRTQVSPLEPPLEPSVKKSTRSEAKRPTYPEEFEALWRVHPRGPKQEALPYYRKAIQIIPPDQLILCYRRYVTLEVGEEFRGQHLHRWLRDERWEEYVNATANGNGTHWAAKL